MVLEGPRPYDPGDLRCWLEAYRRWRSDLASGGLQRADAGSSIRAVRVGRPTEAAALHVLDLAARCLVVETWLSGLSLAELILVERHLSRGAVTVAQIAGRVGLRYPEAAAAVRLLPHLIYWRWYGMDERGDRT